MWWLFVLLAGDWNRIEWLGAACAATVGATVAEIARTTTRLRPGVPPGRLARVPSALAMVVVDFGILTVALGRSVVRRRVVRGRYVVRASPQPDASHRAWTTLVAGFSPNAYVVDFDAERGTVLLHDLVPNRGSESPA